jgi:hypothetical protein
MVMKALLNALQDEGFIVRTANTDLGLIMASKEKSRLEWYGLTSRSDATYSWDCSVNVTAFGQQTKVRINVQLKKSLGGRESVAEFDDPTYYQSFFAKVDKSVFIQKERL